MSEERQDNRLHLPDLSITGFRGIASLTIKRLGRVTLIAGKNSVGKTSVLDAVRVYAARGEYGMLSDLLRSRDEIATYADEDGERRIVADFPALLHGRDMSKGCISIGPMSNENRLMVKPTILSNEQASRLQKLLPSTNVEEQAKAFKIVFQDTEQVLPLLLLDRGSAVSKRTYRYVRQMSLSGEADVLSRLVCESLGPDLLSNLEIAQYWDVVALTDEEYRAVEALRMILGSEVDRVAAIGDDRRLGRRVAVKLKSQPSPVPLKSLGDGALRLFSVALALANSRDGFLLIDEAENGIHHTVQRDFWRMVLRTANENNVQVFATTHSYDCVRGFAQAVTECGGIDGGLVRLERRDKEMWAVEYTEDDLRVVADQRIEVR